MIYANTVIIVLYVALAIISRKHFSKYKDGTGILSFMKGLVPAMGECIWSWACKTFPLDGVNIALEKLLRRGQVVAPRRIRQERESFVAKCLGLALVVFFLCNLMEFFGEIRRLSQEKDYGRDGDIIIQRDSYEGDYKRQEIYYELSGTEQQVVLEVSPVRLTEEEFHVEADRIASEVEDEYLRQGDLIWESIELPVSYRNGVFSLSWESQNPELISSRGRISEDLQGEPKEASLRMTVIYYDYSATYSFSVLVGPKQLSQDEQISEKLSQSLAHLEQNTVGQAQLVVPSDFEGLKLSVKETRKRNGTCLFFGGIIGLLVPMVGVSRLKDKEKARNILLMKAYPYFVDSLWLYIESGMTIKRALKQYTDSADVKDCHSGCDSYLVREIQYTLNEIATGQSEYDAYDELGGRLGLPVYTSLMRHISQNLKMGTKDLRGLMETEVSMALDSRRESAKRLGEEASTKLIFPMIVLLMVVMVIIIAPAMMGL